MRYIKTELQEEVYSVTNTKQKCEIINSHGRYYAALHAVVGSSGINDNLDVSGLL